MGYPAIVPGHLTCRRSGIFCYSIKSAPCFWHSSNDTIPHYCQSIAARCPPPPCHCAGDQPASIWALISSLRALKPWRNLNGCGMWAFNITKDGFLPGLPLNKCTRRFTCRDSDPFILHHQTSYPFLAGRYFPMKSSLCKNQG